ncbi:prion-like-(Q/N-rich) domain-bearing protein 25 [Periplaneta americana]|uniref:prion-like-(Q/N-rich) domain-bearing protein 25 n=1 Tax=Periplaneta americana TaxID=6978 RepID=UPI0037E926E9
MFRISSLVIGTLTIVGLLGLGRTTFEGIECGDELPCIENSFCNNETWTCECNDFFVMSADWTKCLPIIATPYLSVCEESTQCTPRMGQGASCEEAKCVCTEGFHYLHGLCYKSSGYGEDCSTDDDCFGGFSHETLSCVNNKCTCSENYYLIGADDCRKIGTADGDDCAFDNDCQYEGGFCNTADSRSYVCTSANESVLSLPDDSVLTQSALNAKVDQAASTNALGGVCTTSEECSSDLPNSECFGGICVCELGYSDYNSECKPDLGEKCSNPEEYIKYAKCTDELNSCHLPNIISEDNRSCRAGRLSTNNQCQVPEQCRLIGGHTRCIKVITWPTCECEVGYHFVDEIKICLKDKGIGDTCEHGYECAINTGNATCIENVCQCLEGHHATNGDCTVDVVALNDSCLAKSDCSDVIEFSSCIGNTCQCDSGYYQDPSRNDTCITGIGGACSSDSGCGHIHSSYCSESEQKCACVDGTVQNEEGSKCLQIASTFGDDCEEDVQCIDALGKEGSACLMGLCLCTDNYHFRNHICVEKRFLGDVCEKNMQCYLESNQTDRVQCQNGKCLCTYDYVQTEDLDCKSSSARVSSSTIITGVCLVIGVVLHDTVLTLWK